MELISQINSFVNKIVWGPAMLAFLIGAGLFLSLKLGFLQFRKFGYMMKSTILGVFSCLHHAKDESGVSSFQAVATAMYRQHCGNCHGHCRRRPGCDFLDVGQRTARHGDQVR